MTFMIYIGKYYDPEGKDRGRMPRALFRFVKVDLEHNLYRQRDLE